MTKVARNRHFVWPDRYYIWTYFPEKFRKSIKHVTKDRLYAKHYTCIPYFSRQHAKHVVCSYHGTKALHYIHIIHGSRLIKQGITTFNQANGQKDYNHCCFIKSPKIGWYPAQLRQWFYPPEYLYDAHRRRKYIVSLNRALGDGKKAGRKRFNKLYAKYNIGNNYRRISKTAFRIRYLLARRITYTLLNLEEMQNTLAKLEIKGNSSIYPLTIRKCKRQGLGRILSEDPITINSKAEFDTLLEEVKQFNNDPGNQRRGLHILIKI